MGRANFQHVGPMSEGRLQSLLLAWQEELSRGRDAPAAELCRECPELAEELSQRIRTLRQMNALLLPEEGAHGAATGNWQAGCAGAGAADTLRQPGEFRSASAVLPQ